MEMIKLYSVHVVTRMSLNMDGPEAGYNARRGARGPYLLSAEVQRATSSADNDP
jgi:hypothetical protein